MMCCLLFLKESIMKDCMLYCMRSIQPEHAVWNTISHNAGFPKLGVNGKVIIKSED